MALNAMPARTKRAALLPPRSKRDHYHHPARPTCFIALFALILVLILAAIGHATDDEGRPRIRSLWRDGAVLTGDDAGMGQDDGWRRGWMKAVEGEDDVDVKGDGGGMGGMREGGVDGGVAPPPRLPRLPDPPLPPPQLQQPPPPPPPSSPIPADTDEEQPSNPQPESASDTTPGNSSSSSDAPPPRRPHLEGAGDPRWDTIAVCLKTGRDVAAERIPIQILTFLSQVRNLVIVAEAPNVNVGALPVVDVYSDLPYLNMPPPPPSNSSGSAEPAASQPSPESGAAPKTEETQTGRFPGASREAIDLAMGRDQVPTSPLWRPPRAGAVNRTRTRKGGAGHGHRPGPAASAPAPNTNPSATGQLPLPAEPGSAAGGTGVKLARRGMEDPDVVVVGRHEPGVQQGVGTEESPEPVAEPEPEEPPSDEHSPPHTPPASPPDSSSSTPPPTLSIPVDNEVFSLPLSDLDFDPVFNSSRRLHRRAVIPKVATVRDGSVPNKLSGGWKLDAHKNLPAWKVLFDKFPNAEWYFMIDDDTFVLFENLLTFITDYDPTQLWFLGAANVFIGCDNIKRFGTGPFFAHGGSGILLSRATMLRLLAILPSCIHKYRSCWAGDVRTALCLRDAGVLVRGRSGFNGEPPNAKFRWPPQPVQRLNDVVGARMGEVTYGDVFEAFADRELEGIAE
ncbi:hypothetical protein BDK51DRAFT_26581, partial [Blyttiomyces helicus]